MSMINYASREINCKLVYYGPGRADHQPGSVQQGRARLARKMISSPLRLSALFAIPPG
jgi:hypothetical protein